MELDEIEVLDKGSELFQDRVHHDELLDLFFRKLITAHDLLDRLKYIAQTAEIDAPRVIEVEIRDQREEAYA